MYCFVDQKNSSVAKFPQLCKTIRNLGNVLSCEVFNSRLISPNTR